MDSRPLLAAEQQQGTLTDINITMIDSSSELTKTPTSGLTDLSGTSAIAQVTPSMSHKLASRLSSDREQTTSNNSTTNNNNNNNNNKSNDVNQINGIHQEQQEHVRTPASLPTPAPCSITPTSVHRARSASGFGEPATKQQQQSRRASGKLQTDDTLRRLSKVIHRHISVCKRITVAAHVASAGNGAANTINTFRSVAHTGFRHNTMQPPRRTPLLLEADFVKPRWRYRFHRGTGLNMMSQYTLEKVEHESAMPSETDIYDFFKVVFSHASLSGECGVVCLIYIERLMEVAGLMLLPSNWRPVVLVALLLASKVWQDMSSWNVEFACAFPQFSLQSINRLERLFVEHLRWDLYISGPLYAKYHYALSNIEHRQGNRVRGRYNTAVGILQRPRTDSVTAAAIVESRSLDMRNSLHETSAFDQLQHGDSESDANGAGIAIGAQSLT